MMMRAGPGVTGARDTALVGVREKVENKRHDLRQVLVNFLLAVFCLKVPEKQQNKVKHLAAVNILLLVDSPIQKHHVLILISVHIFEIIHLASLT